MMYNKKTRGGFDFYTEMRIDGGACLIYLRICDFCHNFTYIMRARKKYDANDDGISI